MLSSHSRKTIGLILHCAHAVWGLQMVVWSRVTVVTAETMQTAEAA